MYGENGWMDGGRVDVCVCERESESERERLKTLKKGTGKAWIKVGKRVASSSLFKYMEKNQGGNVGLYKFLGG